MASALLPPDVNVSCKPFCHAGNGKTLLTPPPPAPPCAPSFQTDSAVIVVPEASTRVPPQPSTFGLEAGKSTWLAPSLTPSLEPLSPDATQTVMPMVAAA